MKSTLYLSIKLSGWCGSRYRSSYVNVSWWSITHVASNGHTLPAVVELWTDAEPKPQILPINKHYQGHELVTSSPSHPEVHSCVARETTVLVMATGSVSANLHTKRGVFTNRIKSPVIIVLQSTGRDRQPCA